MNSGRTDNNESPVLVADIESEFLPLIYEIVKCVEKDPADAAGKNKESLDAANKIHELNKRLEKAKEQVRHLQGIDLNPEEQKVQLESLKKQLAQKKELVQKYKSLESVSKFLSLETKLNGSSH